MYTLKHLCCIVLKVCPEEINFFIKPQSCCLHTKRPSRRIKESIRYNHLECLKKWIKLSFQTAQVLKKEHTRLASKYGSFECLKFLLEMNTEIDEKCLNQSARWGHLSCLDLLIEYKVSGISFLTAQAHPRCILTCAKNFGWTCILPEKLAKYKKYNLLKYCLQNGCPLTIETQIFLYKNRYFDIPLDYNNPEIIGKTTTSMTIALYRGDMHMLRLYDGEFTESHALYCVMNDVENFEALKYLYHQGCPGSSIISWIAYLNGHFQSMKFAGKHWGWSPLLPN